LKAFLSSTLAAVLSTAVVVFALLRPQISTPEFMRQKMEEARRLLSAIVLGGFEGVVEHAEELDSLAELQSWYVLPTPEYAEDSKKFREAVQAVAVAERTRDLLSGSKPARPPFESASSVTLTCGECAGATKRCLRQRSLGRGEASDGNGRIDASLASS
jgi:hypothetical protein